MNYSAEYTLSTRTTNQKQYLLLFILWPFLAFLAALKNYRDREARKVVYFFLIYYGLTFVIANPYVDAARYAMTLRENANLPFSDIFKIIGGIYATDTSIDIIEPLISFIVSRFTSFHGVLFAVYAAIFGYFFLKSVNLLYHKQADKPSINSYIFLIFFIFLLPITNINGFRMWTAAWIFFYGAYHVILNRDKKYLLVALSASFVHFSFISANAILLIYFLAGNRNLIYIPLAIISFVSPYLASPIFNLAATRLGGAFQSRYEGYSSDNYIEAIQASSQQASWFIKIGNDMLGYYLIVAIIIIQILILRKKDTQEKGVRNLFSFLFLFLAFVNFAKVIPSFGIRFQIVFFMFGTLYLFLQILKLGTGRIHFITLLGLFPMLLYMAVTFRLGSESINVWMFAPGAGLPLMIPGIGLASYLF